jgi:hypothetical protein
MGSGPLLVTFTEVRTKHGDWIHLNEHMRILGAASRYGPCSTIVPGQSTEIVGARTGLSLLRKSQLEVGEEPTIRMTFLAPCVEPGGALVTPSARTEEFSVHLPLSKAAGPAR